MLKPTFPPKDVICNFIYMTHTQERIDLKMADVQSTFSKRTSKPNPYTLGHLMALDFAIKHLIDKDHFPGKVAALTDPFKSDACLFWLRDLHKQLLQPLSNMPVSMEYEDPNIVLPGSLGKYRQKELPLTSTMAPHPQLIPKLMHEWIRLVAGVNDRLYKKATQLYQLSKDEAKELVQTAHYTGIFFSCVQPFQSGNNRLGRFLGNVLRLHWRLPWQNITNTSYQNFIIETNEFQLKELPHLISTAQKIR